MPDDSVHRMRKAKELLEELKAQQAKTRDTIEEIERLLGGAPSIAALLKDAAACFDEAWCLRYAPGQTRQYAWNHVKDKPQLTRLVKQLGVEEVKRRAFAFIRNNDGFFVRSRHTFGIFVMTINQHAAPMVLAEDARPFDCKHEPRCTTDLQCTSKRALLMDERLYR